MSTVYGTTEKIHYHQHFQSMRAKFIDLKIEVIEVLESNRDIAT